MFEAIAIVLIVLAAVAFVGIKLVRDAAGKTDCCSNCSPGGCGACKTPGVPQPLDQKKCPDRVRG